MSDIKKHIEYAKKGRVTVRMPVDNQQMFFKDDEDQEDSELTFIPEAEYIYIYASGDMYYKAYGSEGSLYVESDYITTGDLKPVKEWAFELNFEN